MGNSSLLFTLLPGAQRPLSFSTVYIPQDGSSRAWAWDPDPSCSLPQSVLRRKSCKGCLRTSNVHSTPTLQIDTLRPREGQSLDQNHLCPAKSAPVGCGKTCMCRSELETGDFRGAHTQARRLGQ